MMKRYSSYVLLMMSGSLVSSFALAEEGVAGVAAGQSAVGMTKLAAALAIGLGAFGAASGQGKAACAALEGIARNPASRGEIFVPLILSLVFMEFQALLCFVVSLNLLG